MRKNKMMRLASVLLVLCLLTTSVISGTFAKYITQDSEKAEARVAKFGVVASVTGDLFGATYADATNDTIISYDVNDGTVSSMAKVDGTADSFVVAPGAKNIEGLKLNVTGNPEVSTKVTFDTAENAGVDYADSDIFLGEGVYGVMVPVDDNEAEFTAQNIGNFYVKDSNGNYELADHDDIDSGIKYELHDVATAVAGGYYPLVWELEASDDTYDLKDENATRKIADVKAKLTALFNAEFDPNAFVEKNAVVTWSWAYGDKWDDGEGADHDALEKISDIDRQDTILGHMIAEAKEDDERLAVVKMDTGTGLWYPVQYGTRDAANGSENTVQIVTVGDKEVACLTVAFNARLTVEQVD